MKSLLIAINLPDKLPQKGWEVLHCIADRTTKRIELWGAPTEKAYENVYLFRDDGCDGGLTEKWVAKTVRKRFDFKCRVKWRIIGKLEQQKYIVHIVGGYCAGKTWLSDIICKVTECVHVRYGVAIVNAAMKTHPHLPTIEAIKEVLDSDKDDLCIARSMEASLTCIKEDIVVDGTLDLMCVRYLGYITKRVSIVVRVIVDDKESMSRAQSYKGEYLRGIADKPEQSLLDAADFEIDTTLCSIFDESNHYSEVFVSGLTAVISTMYPAVTRKNVVQALHDISFEQGKKALFIGVPFKKQAVKTLSSGYWTGKMTSGVMVRSLRVREYQKLLLPFASTTAAEREADLIGIAVQVDTAFYIMEDIVRSNRDSLWAEKGINAAFMCALHFMRAAKVMGRSLYVRKTCIQDAVSLYCEYLSMSINIEAGNIRGYNMNLNVWKKLSYREVAIACLVADLLAIPKGMMDDVVRIAEIRHIERDIEYPKYTPLTYMKAANIDRAGAENEIINRTKKIGHGIAFTV